MKNKKHIKSFNEATENSNKYDFISDITEDKQKIIDNFLFDLSQKVKEIAKKENAVEDRILYRIDEKYIEFYEIDESEDLVERFLGIYPLFKDTD